MANPKAKANEGAAVHAIQLVIIRVISWRFPRASIKNRNMDDSICMVITGEINMIYVISRSIVPYSDVDRTAVYIGSNK